MDPITPHTIHHHLPIRTRSYGMIQTYISEPTPTPTPMPDEFLIPSKKGIRMLADALTRFESDVVELLNDLVKIRVLTCENLGSATWMATRLWPLSVDVIREWWNSVDESTSPDAIREKLMLTLKLVRATLS